MRIAILANADIGLYKFRKELLERLCSEHEVHIILPGGEYIEELQKIGCRFTRFEFDRRGMNPIADLKQIASYRTLLRDLSPDVVLTYTIKPNVYGGLACQKLGIPYIANVTGLGTAIENGGLLSLISKTLYRRGLRKAACVFFQNSANQKLFVEEGIVKGKTRLIPGSGVNLESHSLEPYPSEEDGFRFLFVGRLMKDKGIDELLYAIRKLHRKDSSVRLDIVGWSDENDPAALREAEKEGAVIHHGLQSDVHPFYKNCHCAVLPSYHEGTANVMLEASATGRPVITTGVPGCRETFEEGVTGLGCEAKDKDSLFDAMEKMVSLSPETRREMGIRGRKKMEEEYDRQIVIDAYLEELKHCSGRKET